MSLGRWWRTVRLLPPEQLLARVWFRLYRPRPNLAPPPPLRPVRGRWVVPPPTEPSLVGPKTFRFHGVEGDLDVVGWDGPQRTRLWRYHQHYFEDLLADGAAARRPWHEALLRRWVADNPPGRGVGWEPYPTSRRIVHWIAWALGGGELPAEAVASLAVQARWLERRLERHLRANHLWANAVALVFAGAFFLGPEADRWLARGLALLMRELGRQILPDGAHYERSPMYHAQVLRDLLDLENLAGAYPDVGAWAHVRTTWRARLPAMRRFLLGLTHPDGEIAFFNDAAFGVVAPPAQLEAYAERLGLGPAPPLEPGLLHWPEAGYVRLSDAGAVALLDCAPVGPDEQPGHAHADTLSFELSIGQRRFLVNGGTSTYEVGPERLWQRGTAAHSTVIVDGENSSEVWASFRVGRRARPFGFAATPLDRGGWRVVCAHDGYRHRPGAPVHRRTWIWRPGELRVEDVVTPARPAEARFLLHPAWRLEGTPQEGVASAEGARVRWRVERGCARLESAHYHPRFGATEPTTCLAVALVDGQAIVRFLWDAPCTSSS